MVTLGASMTGEKRTTQPWYLAATSGATRPWLIRLRWVTAAIEATVVVVILLLPRLDLSLDHVTWLIAAAAAANAVVARLLSTRVAVPAPVAAAAMAIDKIGRASCRERGEVLVGV